MATPSIIEETISNKFGFGVSVSSEQTKSGNKLTIRPLDIEDTISFYVEVTLSWRTISISFHLGNFANSLVLEMNNSTSEQKNAFTILASSLKSKGAVLDLHFDKVKHSAIDNELWPINWKSIRIKMKKNDLILEQNNQYNYETALPWIVGFFGLCMSMIPLEEIEEQVITGEMEGACSTQTIKKYERSRINRVVCLEIHGSSCCICKVNFGEKYGVLGEGFIHVHHIIPLSEMGEEYSLDPSKDLIPVCPNCHAMLHRKQPAILPDELKRIIEYSNRSN